MSNLYEPILKEIASGMLETAEFKKDFSNDALVDALLIFETVLVDKVFDCMQADGSSHEDQENMIDSCGKELRKLIHTYTGLDTVVLFENHGK